MTAAQIQADAIARLAGLSNVVSALLAAIPVMAPETRMDALQTCASMADDVARNLGALVTAGAA